MTLDQNAQSRGVDLARVALKAAGEAAKKNGGGRAKQPKRRTRVAGRDGRDPMGLGDAIGALITERAWDLPAVGGALRDRWAAIAPDFAGHVAATGFDADSGQLTLRPESTAWATKARIEQARIIRDANKAAGKQAVRTIRVLAPGSVPASATAADTAPVPARSAPEAPVRTRKMASAGYQRAREALQASKKAQVANPAIQAAVERQIREQAREPEEQFGDGEAARAELRAKAERAGSVDASRARALKRLADERAGRVDSTPRSLGRTA
jgi:predicted nucleic acid-binding Zn ribbon protein